MVVLFLQNVRLTDDQSLESVERDGQPVTVSKDVSRKDRILASFGFSASDAPKA